MQTESTIRLNLFVFCITFLISALLFAHKQLCGKQRADTKRRVKSKFSTLISFPAVARIFGRRHKSFYKESGFARKAPTMDVNSRRHQAFMINRNTCPPNIRHHDLKMLEVVWDAPMENATGAV